MHVELVCNDHGGHVMLIVQVFFNPDFLAGHCCCLPARRNYNVPFVVWRSMSKYLVAVDVVAGGWKAVFLLLMSLVMTCSGGAVSGGLQIVAVGVTSGFSSARIPSLFPYSIINAFKQEARCGRCMGNGGRCERKAIS